MEGSCRGKNEVGRELATQAYGRMEVILHSDPVTVPL